MPKHGPKGNPHGRKRAPASGRRFAPPKLQRSPTKPTRLTRRRRNART